MRPRHHAVPSADGASRPHWSEVLRALREARGSTVEGWGARLGVSGRTVLRWERGERTPDAGAEAVLLAAGRELGLFRLYDRGPLAGLHLTAELLQDLLAEARWRVSGARAAAASVSDQPAITPADGTPLDEARTLPSSLPVQLTSFVGREREIAEVRRVQAGTRLLTLTGAGGCGKTRLALALAQELLWAYPHGVWFVDLAPLADPVLLPQVVASALAIRTAGQQPVTEALIDALRSRQLLLVLDNCEHLLPTCAGLVEMLLRACPHLNIVATSRESLGIGGETAWRVPPMTVPGSTFQAPRAEQQAVGLGPWNLEDDQADSVRLFIERALQHRPEFALTPGSAAAVTEICRRLDGMPLALELAAARVTVLSPEQIVERLDDRFRLLTGGGRTALPRHQTLRATMDWSYELLTEPERVLLRALSVFAGGFTLDAAEAVCADASAAAGVTVIRAADVLDLLARLVDKSLVTAEEHDARSGSDGVRYRLLETVRQYAAAHLTAAGELRGTQERHAAWCLELADAAAVHLTGPDQNKWLERLGIEHDNIRAALGWYLAGERGAAAGLRLGSLLWWFWSVRGHLSEGRRWLAALLARGSDAPPAVRASALQGAGVLAGEQGDYDEAVEAHTRSLALRRELGDDAGVGASLNGLGVVAEARGDYAGARPLFEESLALMRKRGDVLRIARTLGNLGILARRRGDLDQAVAHYQESLALMRELGDTGSVAIALQNLGNVHRDQGALESAAAQYRESLSLYRELQDRRGVAHCLLGMAAVAGKRGDAARSARLCGAVIALREAIGAPIAPANRANFERITAAARVALGEADFAAAWAVGAALSLEEAITDALSDGPSA